MAFEAAVNTIDITPVAPPYPSLWMSGYGWTPRGNHGVIARPLRAHCLVIWEDDRPIVLVRADVISIPRDVNQWIRGTLADEGVVAENDLMMVASHTHSGACYGDIRPSPYVLMNLTDADIAAVNGTTNVITEALIDLVRETVEMDRTEVTLGYTEGAANLGFNRVDENNGAVLDTVPVLRVDTTDGDLFAVVFGAACHPVSRGIDDVFDADFPGVASELIENALGVPALFVQGAAGDQEAHAPHGPAMPDTLGNLLGDEVLNQLDTADFSEVTGPIRTSMIEVDVPFNVDTSDEDVRDMLKDKYQARLNSLNSLDANWRHADLMLRLIKADELPTSLPMPIQAWRFGGLDVIALAHEPLSAYDVKLKQGHPGNLWVVGYANECEAYVADNDTLKAGGDLHGGYEAGWNLGDDTYAGEGAWNVPYAYPAPLKFGRSAGAGTAEKTVLDAARGLLQ